MIETKQRYYLYVSFFQWTIQGRNKFKDLNPRNQLRFSFETITDFFFFKCGCFFGPEIFSSIGK